MEKGASGGIEGKRVPQGPPWPDYTTQYQALPGLGDASLSERDRERQGATPESPSDPRRWQKLARPHHWALAMNLPG